MQILKLGRFSEPKLIDLKGVEGPKGKLYNTLDNIHVNNVPSVSTNDLQLFNWLICSLGKEKYPNILETGGQKVWINVDTQKRSVIMVSLW